MRRTLRTRGAQVERKAFSFMGKPHRDRPDAGPRKVTYRHIGFNAGPYAALQKANCSLMREALDTMMEK